MSDHGGSKRIVFSGAFGQWDKPLVCDPALHDRADIVVMELTYGDRNHRDEGDVKTQLSKIICDACQRGGNVVIPTFAVERAQELMCHLSHLAHEDQIPDLTGLPR